MRIVHLATSLHGGAGIAARRIVQAQVDYGLDSSLIVANGTMENLRTHERILIRSMKSQLESKLLTAGQSLLVQSSDLLVTAFSLSLRKKLVDVLQETDVLHIHAFYNLLKPQDISYLSRYSKVAVTLHDERFFTGGCHYSIDCNGFQSQCKMCPQVRYAARKFPEISLRNSEKSLKNSRGVEFITPSNWLADQAAKSSLLGARRISVISNPIPEEFHPPKIDVSTSQRRLAFPRLSIGFVSENLNNPYKGLEVLRDAIKIVSKVRKIDLKLFGSGDPGFFPPDVALYVSKFANPQEAQRAITSCDLIIVPSIQDNSPSVVSESLMCSTPVLGSDVGGLTETLREFNQPIFRAGDSEDLAKKILGFEPVKLDVETLELVRQKYAFASSAKKHIAVYENN